VSAKASLVGELLSYSTTSSGPARRRPDRRVQGGGRQAVATLQKAGLAPFGQDGDPFDRRCTSVQHDTSPDVTGRRDRGAPPRYRLGDRILRAALVAVTDMSRTRVNRSRWWSDTVAEPVAEADDNNAVDSDGTTAH